MGPYRCHSFLCSFSVIYLQYFVFPFYFCIFTVSSSSLVFPAFCGPVGRTNPANDPSLLHRTPEHAHVQSRSFRLFASFSFSACALDCNHPVPIPLLLCVGLANCWCCSATDALWNKTALLVPRRPSSRLPLLASTNPHFSVCCSEDKEGSFARSPIHDPLCAQPRR
jgi:hypothetical protein